MSTTDLCECGHRRDDHLSRDMHNVEVCRFRECPCHQYVTATAKPADPPDWLRLAMLALLVERGQANIESALDMSNASIAAILMPPGRTLHQVLVSTKQNLDSHKSNPAELAEAMANVWMERAQALGVDSRRDPGPCTSKAKCHVCSAAANEWCRAVHAGERDAGGWVHPNRGKPVFTVTNDAIARLRHTAFAMCDAMAIAPGSYLPLRQTSERLIDAALAVPIPRGFEDLEDDIATDPSTATGRTLDRRASALTGIGRTTERYLLSDTSRDANPGDLVVAVDSVTVHVVEPYDNTRILGRVVRVETIDDHRNTTRYVHVQLFT